MLMRLAARALLLVMWLLHWLPLPVLAALGRGLGAIAWWGVRSRREVALRNLELCLPEMSLAQRRAIAREHFALLGRSVTERGLLWHSSAEQLKRLIHVEGDARLPEHAGRPVMWLVPHFIGLDIAGAAVQLYQSQPVVSMYQMQSNPVFEEAVLRGRLRFGGGRLFSRWDGARSVIRSVREGHHFFNLPDMDFGAKDAAFVPFFGVPAATLLAPSRMAKALDMVVQPVVTEVL
ncbi:MAG TPA: lipid A biosynthesis acyltransferase, partial [Burkholderiaceae bacterium]|nr:lipid A biosynthesis acyltransferase [Burkholderiaceae bacterium]